LGPIAWELFVKSLAKTKTNPKTTKDTKEHGGEQTTVEYSEVVSKKFRSPDC
jgi:hypothetical protein